MTRVALSTIDNPFSPFIDFKAWYMFDHIESVLSKVFGFTSGCSETLARVAFTSEQLTDEENHRIIDEAIDDIIANDITEQYVKLIEFEENEKVLNYLKNKESIIEEQI